MGEMCHLFGDRRHHLWVAVAGVKHRNAPGKIDVPFPFNIP
jgi:hypothetical protein